MLDIQKFTCNYAEEEEKQRLDMFLKEQLVDFSRTKIQKAIKDKAVTVNGEVMEIVHHFLDENDVVEIDIDKIAVKKKVDDGSVDFKVYYEDKDILVIEKPAGVIVHQFGDQAEYSLADELVKRYPDIKGVGEDPIRPGIVHRIDKNVSGLMVVARTQQAFENLKDQFKERIVEKEYIVLVEGLVKNYMGSIDFRIGRTNNAKNRMAAFPNHSEDGKDALTHYTVVGNYKKNTLMRIKIETGRTHQIRVHMQAFGHLVVGDNVYNKKKHGEGHVLPRIFLHSASLGFNHPVSGERVHVESNLPLDLKNHLNTLTGRNKLILVSGPSGSGKSTLIDSLNNKYPGKFAKPTTYTTRPARESEEKIMFNVSKPEFEERKANDEFLEWAEFNDNFYATHKESLFNSLKKLPLVMAIDVQGAKQIMDKMPEVYSIFIEAKNDKMLRKRLEKRDDLTEEQIEERLEIAKKEYTYKPLYDLFMVNHEGKVEQAGNEFAKLVDNLIEENH